MSEKCKQTVYPSDRWGSFHGYRCTRNEWKDGFCKTHHPETIKARSEASEKRWREKMDNSPLSQAMRRIQELEATIAKMKEIAQ